jgi:hypothetical protein
MDDQTDVLQCVRQFAEDTAEVQSFVAGVYAL